MKIKILPLGDNQYLDKKNKEEYVQCFLKSVAPIQIIGDPQPWAKGLENSDPVVAR